MIYDMIGSSFFDRWDGCTCCLHTHACTRRRGPSSRWATSRIHSMWGCCTAWTWRCGRCAPPPARSSRAKFPQRLPARVPVASLMDSSMWLLQRADWGATDGENEDRLTMSVSFFLRFLRSGLATCCKTNWVFDQWMCHFQVHIINK